MERFGQYLNSLSIPHYNTFHSLPPLLPSKHMYSSSPRQATLGNLIRFPPDILNFGAGRVGNSNIVRE